MYGFRINREYRIREHSDIWREFLRERPVRHRENKRRRVKFLWNRVFRIGRNARSGLCFDKAGRK